jgi:hypothetical protein
MSIFLLDMKKYFPLISNEWNRQCFAYFFRIIFLLMWFRQFIFEYISWKTFAVFANISILCLIYYSIFKNLLYLKIYLTIEHCFAGLLFKEMIFIERKSQSSVIRNILYHQSSLQRQSFELSYLFEFVFSLIQSKKNIDFL